MVERRVSIECGSAFIQRRVHPSTCDSVRRGGMGPGRKHPVPYSREVIDLFEAQAGADVTFLRMLTGVWRYTMTDEVWARIRRLQELVADKLPEYRGD